MYQSINNDLQEHVGFQRGITFHCTSHTTQLLSYQTQKPICKHELKRKDTITQYQAVICMEVLSCQSGPGRQIWPMVVDSNTSMVFLMINCLYSSLLACMLFDIILYCIWDVIINMADINTSMVFLVINCLLWFKHITGSSYCVLWYNTMLLI